MLSPLRSPYGIVDVRDDGRIESFSEKPLHPYFVNAGIYVLSREIAPLLRTRAITRQRRSPNSQRRAGCSATRARLLAPRRQHQGHFSEAATELAVTGRWTPD